VRLRQEKTSLRHPPVYFAGTIDPNSIQFDPNSDFVFASGTAGNSQFSCGGANCDQGTLDAFANSIFGQSSASVSGNTSGGPGPSLGFFPGPPPPPKGLRPLYPQDELPTLQKPPINPTEPAPRIPVFNEWWEQFLEKLAERLRGGSVIFYISPCGGFQPSPDGKCGPVG